MEHLPFAGTALCRQCAQALCRLSFMQVSALCRHCLVQAQPYAGFAFHRQNLVQAQPCAVFFIWCIPNHSMKHVTKRAAQLSLDFSCEFIIVPFSRDPRAAGTIKLSTRCAIEAVTMILSGRKVLLVAITCRAALLDFVQSTEAPFSLLFQG